LSVISNESSVLSSGNNNGYYIALKNILNSTNEKNKAIIYEFLEKECNRKGLSEGRKQKYIRIVKKTLKFLNDKTLAKISQENVETFFLWLRNNEAYSDETKDDYWKSRVRLNSI